MNDLINCLNLCPNINVYEDNSQSLGIMIEIKGEYKTEILEFVSLVLKDFI